MDIILYNSFFLGAGQQCLHWQAARPGWAAPGWGKIRSLGFVTVGMFTLGRVVLVLPALSTRLSGVTGAGLSAA